jgi:hypothetical protein
MPFTNKIKESFSFSKLFSVFQHHFWFWRKRFSREGFFWHILAQEAELTNKGKDHLKKPSKNIFS